MLLVLDMVNIHLHGTITILQVEWSASCVNNISCPIQVVDIMVGLVTQRWLFILVLVVDLLLDSIFDYEGMEVIMVVLMIWVQYIISTSYIMTIMLVETILTLNLFLIILVDQVMLVVF